MRLRDIAFALPTKRIGSEIIAEWTGVDADFITQKIGVKTRAFLSAEETPLSLAKEACDALFSRNPQLAQDKVQLLIVVTQNPDFKLPHSSALVQNALGLDVNTACFDINLGCSGYVYALTVAKSFMVSEGITDGLIVTCDPYSRIMGKSDRDTVTVFGDAATATWLSSEAGGEIGRLDFGTDGGRARHLMVKAGGSSYPVAGIWEQEQTACRPEDFRLRMSGQGIFNFAMERVPKSVLMCLEKNKLSIPDIDYFVFHQGSKFLLENLRKRLNLDPEKVPLNLENVGNTVSSSIPLLLSQMRDKGVLGGKRVLISGFGVGLSWASTTIDFGGFV
jgi:3-oxoacyl-[acyl-carrier-protein] synthase-3